MTSENAAVAAATDKDAETWRDWHYGDVPCTYSGGCSEPLRSHTHLNIGPGRPVITVYYDQEPSRD